MSKKFCVFAFVMLGYSLLFSFSENNHHRVFLSEEGITKPFKVPSHLNVGREDLIDTYVVVFANDYENYAVIFDIDTHESTCFIRLESNPVENGKFCKYGEFKSSGDVVDTRVDHSIWDKDKLIIYNKSGEVLGYRELVS